TTLFRSFKVRIEFILRKIRHKFQNTFSSYCCYTCSCCCYEICLDILKTIIVIDMWSNFLNNSNIVYIKESLEYFDKGYHTIENVSALWSTSMNNPMSWVALLDEQRRKKSADVCHDSRLATERYEQETILRGKW